MTKWDSGSRDTEAQDERDEFSETRDEYPEPRDHEYGESITIYRAEDSGPDFSDEEIEYKDVKVGTNRVQIYQCCGSASC